MYDNIIVIPYRNRQRHLNYFIDNSIPLIKQYLPNTKVVVIEQNEGKLFNRGAIINVAFKEYLHDTKYFITNDVDINPTEKCLKELYSANLEDKSVLAIYSSWCNTLGGIIKIHSDSINKMNGFPNDIWGWGVEDKALQNRAEIYGIKKYSALIARSNGTEYPDYLKRFDDVEDRITSDSFRAVDQFHYHTWPNISNEEKIKYITTNGINTLKYTVIERKCINDIIDHIKVDI